MILLQAQRVARHFGADVLFEDITMEIKDNARLALVGRNGSGKSTLLKIIAGEEAPDEGQISKAKDITIGYLEQQTGLDSSETIWDEMLSVFAEVIQMEKELRETEVQLSLPNVLNDQALYEKTLQRYDSLQHAFREANGYGYQNEIRSILHGFRFYEEDYDRPIEQLSGGQKTRLALARLLLEKKDLLILDEPTNHLDIETLSWLETYLQSYPGALLIVSHDRYFLDKVVNEVYELSRRRLTQFKGNYSAYLDQKAALIEQEWKQYEKQQKEIAKLEDFIDRNLVRASTTKRAQSRRKKLEKMDKMDKPQGDEKSASFQFRTDRESGNIVLQATDLAVGYDHSPVSSGIELDIRKGDAVAVVGPNGIGKSTLLKTLTGDLPSLQGDVRLGTKVDIGYYDQEQTQLHPNKTVLSELWDEHPTMPEKDIRTLLGSFLFSGDDVEKTISSLSGGEKARVALAKLALERNNTLILDEPTNHLDVDSKEVLENALIDFDGTLLFVSHDRYFINRIANKVVDLSEDGATLYLGDYDYFIQKKAELEELERIRLEKEQPAETETGTADAASEATLSREAVKELQRKKRQLERRVEEIEAELANIETELTQLQLQLSKPDVYEDYEKAAELSEKVEQLQAAQHALMEEWEEKALELEDIQ
ncbi:ABC-F family ATP-binding cassette domain-containing protein [Atopococcus tabaci]|uniref:ABC-F family ATP-binding cassette domain-containing protein n=1 Tax=Atopococcus tabaci TaxID=269774 RepID=UPI0004039CA6|nr:ABC-F type ribosomal protection protein [Atopococcus tabaci]